MLGGQYLTSNKGFANDWKEKRVMKKKWLALFLCVSMTASLFGCQSKAPVESEQTVTEETPDAAETAEEKRTMGLIFPHCALF